MASYIAATNTYLSVVFPPLLFFLSSVHHRSIVFKCYSSVLIQAEICTIGKGVSQSSSDINQNF